MRRRDLSRQATGGNLVTPDDTDWSEAEVTVRRAVHEYLNQLEAQATASDHADLVFAILELKQRLGLPLQ
jgi:hypothetical protein